MALFNVIIPETMSMDAASPDQMLRSTTFLDEVK